MSTAHLSQSTGRRDIVVGSLAMVGTTAAWGVVAVAPQLVDAPATLLAGLRYLIHGLVCLALLQRLRNRGTTVPAWDRAARHGLTGFVGYFLLLATAVRTGGAPLVVMVMAASPIVLTIATRPALRLRRLLAPGALLLGGGVLATSDGTLLVAGPGASALAAVLALAAMASWTWYAVDNGRTVADRGLDLHRWTATTGVTTGLLALPLVAHGLTSAGDLRVLVDPRLLAVAAFIGIISTTIASRGWNTANRNLGTQVTASLLVLETVFGLLWAHLYAGAVPTGRVLLGEVVLVAGAGWTLRRVLAARRGTAPEAAVDATDEHATDETATDRRGTAAEAA